MSGLSMHGLHRTVLHRSAEWAGQGQAGDDCGVLVEQLGSICVLSIVCVVCLITRVCRIS